MILSDIGMLLIENNRSRAYLQRMLFHGLQPSSVLLLEHQKSTPTPGQQSSDLSLPEAESKKKTSDKFFELQEKKSLVSTLEESEVPYSKIRSSDVNSSEVIEYLQGRPESIWVYSGPGGTILKKPVLNSGKRFLHIHPGAVPEYRGSTTIYYSLLNEGSCGASAIFLSAAIDEGPLLKTRQYPPPQDRSQIDYLFDPLLRSELLIEVLQDYVATGEFLSTTQPEGGSPYFIMHPVLRHICILKTA